MMGTQAFQATPGHHAPAVVIGIIPVIAAYVSVAVKHALFVSGIETGSFLFNPEINDRFVLFRSFYSDGAFALEQGWVYTSIVLSAATVCIIERQFRRASAWFLAGAILSAIGFIHTYQFIETDVIGKIGFSLSKWTWGYLAMALILFITPWITEHEEGPGPV